MLSVPNKLRMALPHLSVGDTETVRDVIPRPPWNGDIVGIRQMMTNEELARVLASRSTASLWELVNEVMDEAAPSGEIDAGLLALVDACVEELGHRQPELFGTPAFDEFHALVAEKLAALPPVGHA
jgi:hypothetical protein